MDNEKIDLLKGTAKEAGDILMRYRTEGFSVGTKTGAFDFVTDADTASDAFLVEKLASLFPEDKILIEESTSDMSDLSGRVWMVDPLDGTKHYIAGGDGFSVIIGLAVDGLPQLGVVYAPERDTYYWAEVGKGAWRQVGNSAPERLHVSSIKKMEKATLIVRYPRGEKRKTDGFLDALVVKNRVQESSVGLQLGKIAEGSADAVYNLTTHANKWDYCAPEIILKEAGGMLTNFHGDALNYLLPYKDFFAMTIASNGLLHKELLERAKQLL